MYRSASRLIARSAVPRAFPRIATPTSRRFISTAPPTAKSRSWKSMVARVGIAGTIIYYYNTTDVFAEEPRHVVQPLPETTEENEQLLTIEALAQERQQRKASVAATEKHTAPSSSPSSGAQETHAAGGVQDLQEEADQQGAFNPETGEINWDCPCLGGMAHGPCGEEFRAAFSCFVYSTEEPKGMDCIEKFKGMQGCFREYPEIYGTELDTDDDDDVTADQDQPFAADSPSSDPPQEPHEPKGPTSPQALHPKEKVGAAAPKQPGQPSPDREGRQERAKAATKQVAEDHGDAEKRPTDPKKPGEEAGMDSKKRGEEAKRAQANQDHGHKSFSENEDLIPKASHDATEANQGK